MAVPVHVPRVNNNDDRVRLNELKVEKGAQVRRGDVIGMVETDKSVLEVEAPADGYVLQILGAIGDEIAVGSVLVWLGQSPDEVPPAAAVGGDADSSGSGISAKAKLLLRKHGLKHEDVAPQGGRVDVAAIEAYLAGGRSTTSSAAAGPARGESAPAVAGRLVNLKTEERGMLHTVAWHRDVAAAGYIEISYDPAPWTAYAAAFQARHGLMLNPMLNLMAWRVARLAREIPHANATIVGEKRFEYDVVNMGFTIQAGEVLYLAVVREACKLDELGFVNRLAALQRGAAVHKLGPEETSGATISFSSMSRWKVSRHIPILPPQTSLIVAHAVGADGTAVLGASYDHRVLNGARVTSLLIKLSKPEEPAGS
jgi:pyruvate/2-oxoglutarate dehydrogenase complex dihydrolipoamide acyltransferase (E2) component